MSICPGMCEEVKGATIYNYVNLFYQILYIRKFPVSWRIKYNVLYIQVNCCNLLKKISSINARLSKWPWKMKGWRWSMKFWVELRYVYMTNKYICYTCIIAWSCLLATAWNKWAYLLFISAILQMYSGIAGNQHQYLF